MPVPDSLAPPHAETATRLSPDGRQVVSESWHLFHQGVSDRLGSTLVRVAALEATLATAQADLTALTAALAAETARATAAEAAGLGQPRLVAGDSYFEFAPNTYLRREVATGKVFMVVNSILRDTWLP